MFGVPVRVAILAMGFVIVCHNHKVPTNIGHSMVYSALATTSSARYAPRF